MSSLAVVASKTSTSPNDHFDFDFDFVIAGVGSAGCALANRLIERSIGSRPAPRGRSGRQQRWDRLIHFRRHVEVADRQPGCTLIGPFLRVDHRPIKHGADIVN
jgi:hypothetical protein